MRNFFIVNPAAGQGEGNESFVKKIEEACGRLEIEPVIYVTKCEGDAKVAVARLIEENAGGEELRFFACGGDGTLNEVMNAIREHTEAACGAQENNGGAQGSNGGAQGSNGGAQENNGGAQEISAGVIPIGTGNDFIRNFGTAEQFTDIEAQLKGTPKQIDLIRYESTLNGTKMCGVCVNMFNIGFDANVVDITGRLKQKPFLSGSLAYLFGVAAMLVKKKGANLKIEADGEVLSDGRILLSAFANGCFCGGGVKGIPRSVTDDGLLDISIIKNVSRFTFIRLFPRYSKGTHLEIKNPGRIFGYLQKKAATVTAIGGPMRMCVDGEMMDSDRLELVNDHLSAVFIIPQGVELGQQ